MITLYNHTHTVAFESEPSSVFSSGSLPKATSKVMLYNDGQGVLVEAENFRFVLKVEYLDPAFVSAHSLTDDKSLFDLLVTWQNERTGNA